MIILFLYGPVQCLILLTKLEMAFCVRTSTFCVFCLLVIIDLRKILSVLYAIKETGIKPEKNFEALFIVILLAIVIQEKWLFSQAQIENTNGISLTFQ